MRYIVVLALLMVFSGCAHTEPWSKESKLFYGTSVAFQMVDYLQTRSTIDDPRFEEGNDMVGGHPNEGQLVVYMAVHAADAIMDTDQFKAGFRQVIESCIFPSPFIMTGSTGGWKAELNMSRIRCCVIVV